MTVGSTCMGKRRRGCVQGLLILPRVIERSSPEFLEFPTRVQHEALQNLHVYLPSLVIRTILANFTIHRHDMPVYSDSSQQIVY